jgi:hypothetical protein
MQDNNFQKRVYADGSPRRSLCIRRWPADAEGGRGRMRYAVTALARPDPAGTRVLCIRRQPVDAECGRRRIQGYAEGIRTPTTLLVGWPGDPLHRWHRDLAVDIGPGHRHLSLFP